MYRFLVNDQHMRYISTAPDTFFGAEEDRIFESILLSELLPSFPPGSRNNAHLARDPRWGKPTFVMTETVQPAGVKDV